MFDMKKFHRYAVLLVSIFLFACHVQTAGVSNNFQADEAQRIISETEDAAREIIVGMDNSYYRAVEYAARDALTKFPNDSRAESWKWKMAYYAILAGDTQLGNNIYVDLINTTLNDGQVDIESLPSWFHPGELAETEKVIPFTLKVDEAVSLGDEKKYLVSVSSFPGGSCFLVVQSPSGYSTSLLFDGFPDSGFSNFNYDSLECILKDLTNDGNDDVVLDHYKGGHVGFSSINVVDISVTPVQLLPFISQNSEKDFIQYGTVNSFLTSNGKPQVQIVDYAQNCQVSLEKTYEWNGDEFMPLGMKFQANVKDAPLKECLFWSIAYARWVDLNNGINIIDQALRQYEPVAVDEQDKERLEEVRINKALLYLFADRPEDMKSVFEDVLQNPYSENGIWVEPVRNFLDIYETPSDIYRACSELVACVSYDSESCSNKSPCVRDALQYLVSHRSPNRSLNDLVADLQKAGVNIVSTGWLDLDYDGKGELWFVVLPPNKLENSNGELWIASGYPNGIRIFYVAPINGLGGQVPGFQIDLTSTGEKFVKFSQYTAFLWSRNSVTDEPVFHWTPCSQVECYDGWEQVTSQFDELRLKLQSDADLYEIYVEYMNLKKRWDINPSLECATCYFDFGYIAELVGDKKTAIEMYSKLIETSPDHPVTILAKSKLKSR